MLGPLLSRKIGQGRDVQASFTTVKQNVELIAKGVEFFAGRQCGGGPSVSQCERLRSGLHLPGNAQGYGRVAGNYFRQPGWRLIASAADALPSDKFKIGLEMDGGLDVGQLEVGLDLGPARRHLERFQVRKLPGLRRQKVHLSIGPAGELVWQSECGELATGVRYHRRLRPRHLSGERAVPVAARGSIWFPRPASGPAKRTGRLIRTSPADCSPRSSSTIRRPKTSSL